MAPEHMKAERKNLSIGRKLRFSLLATLLFLLCLEGAAQVAYPFVAPETERIIPLPEPGMPRDFINVASMDLNRLRSQAPIPMEEDEERGWALAKSKIIKAGNVQYVINSMGMRAPELDPLDPGEVRLLTLGDSSIFGDNVRNEHVFSNVAAGLLSERWKRKVVGVNGGTPGHATDQSLRTLELFGDKVSPAWVIVGNMWSDIYRSDRMHAIQNNTDTVSRVQKQLSHFASYRLIHLAASPWLRSRKVRWIESMDDIASNQGGPEARVPLAHYIRNLEEMGRMIKNLRARPAFLALPAPMDQDAVSPPETVLEYRLAMKRVAERLGAPFLDGPKLFKEKKATPGYFIDQVHPSEYGHKALGEGLADLLEPFGPPEEGKSYYR